MSSYTRRWSTWVQQEASKAKEKTPECTEGIWSQRVLSTIGKLGPSPKEFEEKAILSACGSLEYSNVCFLKYF